MSKNTIKLLLVLLSLLLVLSAVSCQITDGQGNTPSDVTPPDENGGEGETDGETDSETDGEIDWNNTGLDGLALIYSNKARFRVVYTAEAGSAGIRMANDFVKELRELDVEVEDAVSDRSADDVSDCEIIIGSSVRHRGDALSVSDKYLGDEGYCIKIEGNRILIAGGSEDALKYAFDYYKSAELGINSKTKELPQLAVDPEYEALKLTTYYVESIKIAGKDLASYVILEDYMQLNTLGMSFESMRNFRDGIYDCSGYWLEYGNISESDSYEDKIIIRYVENRSEMSDQGFAIYVDDNDDLIVECSYANAFDDTFSEFLSATFYDVMGKVELDSGYLYTKEVSVARYTDFGANGKDELNDYEAIKKTHDYANKSGQKVIGGEGDVYRVGPSIPRSISIKTDVDWNGCTFLIDDTTSAAYNTRSVSLFLMDRDYPVVSLSEATVDELAGTDATLMPGDTSIPWLADKIEATSLVMFTNAHHMDFVRFGSNQTDGEPRKDVLLVHPDGSIDPSTEVCFEFDDFTLIQIHRTDDTPVTIENGNFINICCRTVVETDYMVKYASYRRGIMFQRSNVTMQNVTHTMQDEPELNKDINASSGGCNESYPYYAFIYTERTYNLLVKDCKVTGHTTYYQAKQGTASNGYKPSAVPAGSYDIVVERSLDVTFKNVIQENPLPTGIGDSRFWGIMSSNWSKNMTFEDCIINRFDAHRSFWGAKLINTEIGHTINLVGGGDLYMENVTKTVGNVFISTRGDYGGSFRGNITLKDCTLAGAYVYNSQSGATYNPNKLYANGTVISIGYSTDGGNGYWDWDFGYTCYMPEYVTLDGFKSGLTKNTYLFNAMPDAAFTDGDHPLHITKGITFKNMSALRITQNTANTMMHSIPVTVISKD